VRNHLGSLALSSKPKTRQMQKTLTYFAATLALLFLSATKLPKSLRADFNFIPAGQVKLNGSLQSVQAYYLLNHEVTNGEYAAFLAYLDTHGTEEEKAIARVRNENWATEIGTFSQSKYQQNFTTPTRRTTSIRSSTSPMKLQCCIAPGKKNGSMSN
jgi:hypothetical protein